MTKPLPARFLLKVDVTPGCHVWTGRLNLKGYGRFDIGSRRNGTRRQVMAHRFAYEHAHGRVAADLVVMHSCDNPRCVNLAHLKVGTPADNAADRDSKGRLGERRGESNGRAKLDEAGVLEVRRRAGAGESRRAIARTLGVSPTAVTDITSGRTWAHVQVAS